MKDLGGATTIGELRKILEDVPEGLHWHGWDDGSIIVEEKNGSDYGFIENETP